MTQLIAILQQLKSHPKEATSTIDKLYYQNTNFLAQLENLITHTNILDQSTLRIAISTFNSLVSRALKSTSIHNDISNDKELINYFIMDTMLLNLKNILFCTKTNTIKNNNNNLLVLQEQIKFKNKILLTPSLMLFLQQISTNHSEILRIYQQAIRRQAYDSLLVILQAIMQSRKIQNSQKIRSVGIFAKELLRVLENNVRVILNKKQREIIYASHSNGQNQKFIVLYVQCLYVIQHSLKLLLDVTKLFQKIKHHEQFEVMDSLYSNNNLGNLLIDIMYWNPISSNIIWDTDLYEQNNKGSILAKRSRINNIKSTALSIFCQILKKTTNKYNLLHTQNPLMHKVPHLLPILLEQLKQQANTQLKSPKFVEGQDQNTKKLHLQYQQNLISVVFCFLAESVYFEDCHQFYYQSMFNREMLKVLFMYLIPTKMQMEQFENEGEQFVAYLEALVQNTIDDSQFISPRYSVTKFIRACCDKIDGFTTYYFDACYKSLVYILNANNKTELYCNLTITESQFDHTPLLIIQSCNKIQIYLFGILSIFQSHIKNRIDLQEAMQALVGRINLEHLSGEILVMTILYKIVSLNCQWIYSAQISKTNQELPVQYTKLITYIFEVIQQEDHTCFLMAMQFVSNFYQYMINELTFSSTAGQKSSLVLKKNNNISQSPEDFHQQEQYHQPQLKPQHQLYLMIISEYIWPCLISKINNSNSLIFFQILTQITQCIHQEKSSEQSNCTIQKLSVLYRLKYIDILQETLKRCCGKLLWLYQQEYHEELLTYKIGYCIQTILKEVYYIIISLKNNRDPNKIAQNRMQMCTTIIQHLIQQSLKHSNISIQQKQQLIQLGGMLLNWKLVFSPSTIQIMIPSMLQSRIFHEQHWLLCMSYSINWMESQDRHKFQQILNIVDNKLRELMNYYSFPQKEKIIQQERYEREINGICFLLNIMRDTEDKRNSVNRFNNSNSNGNYEKQRQIRQLIRIHLLKYFTIRIDEPKQRRKIIQKWRPTSITAVSLFSVYLHSLQSNLQNKVQQQQILTSLISSLSYLVQNFDIYQCIQLIIAVRGAFRYMQIRNIQGLLDVIILALKKLYYKANNNANNNANNHYNRNDNSILGEQYTNQWQTSLRSLLQINNKYMRVCCNNTTMNQHGNYNTQNNSKDPYQLFFAFIKQLSYNKSHGKDLFSPDQCKQVQVLRKIRIIRGEPRKMVTILRR